MKKTTITIGIVLILMATLVAAINYGDIIPRTQLKAWNLSAVNLNREHVRYELNNGIYTQVSNITRIRDVNITHIQYFKGKLISQGFPKKKLIQCDDDDDYTFNQCVAFAKMWLDLSTKEKEIRYREHLVKKYQPEDDGGITLE